MAKKSKPRSPSTEKPETPAAVEPPATPADAAPPARGRWPKWLLLAGVVAAGGGWFAPAIVALTPLRHEIVPRLFPDIEARASTGGASLGWFSPVTLRNVVLRDETGRAWLSIDRLTSARTLWELATDSRQFGRFRVDHPLLTVSVRPNGSNVEDALAAFLAASDGGPTPAFRLELVDARIAVVEAPEQSPPSGEPDTPPEIATRIEEVNGVIEQPADPTAPLTVKLAGSVPAEERTGRFELDARYARGDETNAPTIDVSCKVDNLALDVLETPLVRLGETVRLSGGMNGEARGRVTLTDAGAVIAAGGRLELQKPTLAAPAWIGTDRLSTVFLSAGGAVEFGNNQLALDDVRLDCDLGTFRADGTMGMADLRRPTGLAGVLPALLERDDFRVEGHLDLAKLAALLPETLRLRRDTEITGGRIDLVLTGLEENGNRTVRGRLETVGLSAMSAGRVIHWEQPLQAEIHAVSRPDGPYLEKLECRSDFLQVTARGTLDAATLTARGDLDRLAAELRRFADLGDMRLTGTMTAEFETRRGANDTLTADGRATVEHFELARPGQRPWREERLTLELAAAGTLKGQSLARLDRGTIRLRSGGDEFDLDLQLPTDAAAASPISLRLAGDLASWSARLEPFLPLDGWALSGDVTVTGRATASADQIVIETAQADIERLSAVGHGLFLNEPRVRIVTSGTWEGPARRWTSPMLTWASSSLSLRADQVAVQLVDAGVPQVSGSVVFRGGLQPLMGWWHDPRTPAGQTYAGTVGGRVQFAFADDVTQAQWDVLVKDFVVTNVAAPTASSGTNTWSEPELKLAGRAQYDHRQDRLEIAGAEIRSQALRLDARGTIAEVSTRRQADLTGEVEYDLAKILVALQRVLGDGIRMTGTGTRQLALRGPLTAPAASSTAVRPIALGEGFAEPQRFGNQPSSWPNELAGTAGFGWTSADFYGFHAGPGELNLRLEQGVVHVEPLDLVVSEGRVKATPRLLLNTSPMFLALDKGRLIENVRFSPEMCQNWLKYVAPLLADATEINGKFSVDLSGGMIPLTEPKGGDLAGTLAIHTAQVDPGPLADQFITVANQVKAVVRRQPGAMAVRADRALMTLPEQNVEFWMADGRVHHRQLELQFGDTTIRTEGSVGLDKSLALVAHVPIRDEWLGSDRLAAGLKGQSIRVPIAGTLDRPQIDNRALADLARRLTGNAINGAIRNELGKQLEKLFGPRE